MTTLAIIAFDGLTDIDVFLHWDLLNRPHLELSEPVADWQVRLLGTAPVRDRVKRVEIDRDWRKKQDGLTASDHAPVVAELA